MHDFLPRPINPSNGSKKYSFKHKKSKFYGFENITSDLDISKLILFGEDEASSPWTSQTPKILCSMTFPCFLALKW